ncbi:MAG: hypothetical protein JSW55_00785 [Chloroflexota bacterium]|nr:MAG: hypothetical protein JSW55_00785 [Chloroflexota bacterium]
MKRSGWIVFLFVLFLVVGGLAQVKAAELVHVYELDGNFLDEFGGPSLEPNGSGFLVDGGYMVPEADSGLSLRGVINPDSYSIEVVVRLDGFPTPSECVSGDKVCSAKIIDFKNLSSDDGLYTPTSDEDAGDGRLQICCTIGTDSEEGVIVYGQFNHLVLTRDGDTGLVVGYVNGRPVINIEDTVELAVFSAADNVVHLLMDDTNFVDDPPLGFVERIRIFDGALSSEEVNALLQIDISIRPSSKPSSINARSKGKIPVALLSGANFDAPAEIDSDTLTFGRTGNEDSLAGCSPGAEDANADGLPDLVCHFRTADTGFQRGDAEGILKGRTVNGLPIEGLDSVRIVGRQNCLAPPAGIVSRWPGDGHAGDIADGNDGTLEGNATFADGMVGQAFSFDGDGDYVKVPRAANLDVGGELTIELWMKADPSNPMDSCCQGLVATDHYGFAIANGAGGSVYGVLLFVSGDNGGAHTSDLEDGGYPLNPGEWYHVAGVYDGAHLKLYVNGEMVVEPPELAGTIWPMLETSFLTIGSEDGRTNEPDLIGERYFHGLIDEVGLYNRGLSASEIQAIYSAGSAGMCKGS